jgi:putative membrane protein
MNIFLKWLLTTAAIILTGILVPGITVGSFWTAFWLALLLGLLNVTLKPLLVILTLPINIITLGMFVFVINALMVWLASTVIKGFEVEGFLAALLFSVVLSIIGYFLNELIK